MHFLSTLIVFFSFELQNQNRVILEKVPENPPQVRKCNKKQNGFNINFSQ